MAQEVERWKDILEKKAFSLCSCPFGTSTLSNNNKNKYEDARRKCGLYLFVVIGSRRPQGRMVKSAFFISIPKMAMFL